MTEEELMQKYGEEYAKLKQMRIFELRNYGRERGIKCCAARTKEELIQCILKIGEGIPSEKAETALLLTKEELQILSKFAYIGTRVFNYYRKAQDIDIGYFEFADKIYAHCYAAENGQTSAEAVKESERASVSNRMERELCGDISFYEEGVFKELLAELLADRNYPLRAGEDPIDHCNAEEIYAEKLEEQGLDFVSFVVPSIEEEVRARYISDPTEVNRK